MSGDSQPKLPPIPAAPTIGDLTNNPGQSLGGGNGDAFGKGMGTTVMSGAMGNVAPLIGGVYSAIHGALTPPQANLQDPSAAGAPPTQGQVANDQLKKQLQDEQEIAKQSGYGFFGAGANPEGNAAPQTASMTFMGS